MSGILRYGLSHVFRIDLFSGDIEFLGDVVDRDIGQHKDFMGWKDPEVLAHKDNQLVSVKDPALSR